MPSPVTEPCPETETVIVPAALACGGPSPRSAVAATTTANEKERNLPGMSRLPVRPDRPPTPATPVLALRIYQGREDDASVSRGSGFVRQGAPTDMDVRRSVKQGYSTPDGRVRNLRREPSPPLDEPSATA